MNNSINYSSFITLLMRNRDSKSPNNFSVNTNTDAKTEPPEFESFQSMLHNKDSEQWQGE